MKHLNATQKNILSYRAVANVAGYMVKTAPGKEKLYGITLDGKCFDKKESAISREFGKKGFNICESVPNEAEFIGYYEINAAK